MTFKSAPNLIVEGLSQRWRFNDEGIRASAVATGGLSGLPVSGVRGGDVVMSQVQIQAALCSLRSGPSDRADGPHCEAEVRFDHPGLGGNASRHVDLRACR